MAARDTIRIGDTTLPTVGDLPIAANVKIDQGTTVFQDAAGRATPWAADPTLVPVGISTGTVDNTGGAAGAKRVPYRLGTFKLPVDGGDPVTAATKIGAPVFSTDGVTIGATDAGGTLPPGGQFLGMDPDGSGQAMVGITPMALIAAVAAAVAADDAGDDAAIQAAQADATQALADAATADGKAVAAQADATLAKARRTLITIPVKLSLAANAAVLARFNAPRTGKIKAVALQVTDPATTPAKAGDVSLKINGVAVTGGVVSATSANMTPLGARVACTAITATEACTLGQSITAEWSNAAAPFIEGEAVLQVEIGD